MAALYREGRSLREVGDVVGLPRATVRYHLKKIGVQRRNRLQALRAAGGRISSRLKGRRSPNYKGGRVMHGEGYVLIHVPDHPCADQYGYVLEHRLVIERALGRWLCPDEVVHHHNGDKADNRLSNLELLPSSAEHAALHNRLRKEGKGDAGRDSTR